MEKLVPERVEYTDFWTRYYFLRMVVETGEQRRRELLKGAATAPDEEIAWDEDSDSDSEPLTPQPPSRPPTATETLTITQNTPTQTQTSNPTSDPHPTDTTPTTTTSSLPSSDPSPTINDTRPKPLEARRSQDQHSQPDSDASYDLVSGATSRTPGSPKEDKDKDKDRTKHDPVAEQSDEEDRE